MSDLGNREVMSNNIKKYMGLTGKTRSEICSDLGFSYSTFSDWLNGNAYPRIDKIEMLANYFGIEKSDLIEDMHNKSNEYYINKETKQIAQEIFENKELKALFDAGKNATPEDLNIVKNLLLQLKNKEAGK